MTVLTTHPKFLAGTWRLDPAHSELAFQVRHLAISKVRGTFETFDVTVVTSEDPADTKITAIVDVASVNTKQEARDNHLRSSDFFKVDEHPTIRFEATGRDIVFDGDDFTINGDLTLRGVTKPVTLKGEFGGVITDDYGRTKAGVTASTKINRQDYGVSWNAALEAGGFTLGDDVTISIDLQVDLEK
jgi:polyisoprenoid-binding protein YceI